MFSHDALSTLIGVALRRHASFKILDEQIFLKRSQQKLVSIRNHYSIESIPYINQNFSAVNN